MKDELGSECELGNECENCYEFSGEAIFNINPWLVNRRKCKHYKKGSNTLSFFLNKFDKFNVVCKNNNRGDLIDCKYKNRHTNRSKK